VVLGLLHRNGPAPAVVGRYVDEEGQFDEPSVLGTAQHEAAVRAALGLN
jgi:hypothetical protein